MTCYKLFLLSTLVYYNSKYRGNDSCSSNYIEKTNMSYFISRTPSWPPSEKILRYYLVKQAFFWKITPTLVFYILNWNILLLESYILWQSIGNLQFVGSTFHYFYWTYQFKTNNIKPRGIFVSRVVFNINVKLVLEKLGLTSATCWRLKLVPSNFVSCDQFFILFITDQNYNLFSININFSSFCFK